GLVAAHHLHQWGAGTTLCRCGPRAADDPNLLVARQDGIPGFDLTLGANADELNTALLTATVVIDALFGTGKSRPLSGIFSHLLDTVREAKQQRPELRIIALDLPSGLDADTGAADPACLPADHTITLGFPKAGLFHPASLSPAGKVSVADIGIPAYLAEAIKTETISSEMVRAMLPERPPGANKGSFGRVLVVAGSINYIGAAYLACTGALRVGAGLVTLATAASLLPVLAAKLTEVTYLPLPESGTGVIAQGAARLIRQQADGYQVLAIGCGLGQHPAIGGLIRAALLRREPLSPRLVLDADALNALAEIPEWWQQLGNDAILTPHPGEMARLTGLGVEEVQANRLATAQTMAARWHKTIVLKGVYTIVAAPDGRTVISTTANPGLASAGTGDVLTGAIAGFVAQGRSLFEAAVCGVYCHGEAGELVRARLGDAGMLATDLLAALPLVIKRSKETA
ncbi:MAG: NAD(P)H-hydrate dehydratase, partial [Chloroflexota bacterium]